ncbi:short-chain dehydrogenase protein [Purpureocillium lilacinum]|uniref:Short-chain dehydrogenase protein n=1 Tax=Purpureocillium lilacinum TaxID=33203 RepID=A0A179HRV3_PURLI|nr:short-chain dehydrogenase protein [Purpureocillium lilacinum]OAQ92093.1 short-chain dehydrogenase protein [Purpureocillium lilacinum]
MPGTISVLQQFFCPGKPRFTEQHVPDLTDKIVVVTGSNTGLGKEIARIVYSKNATVYMMARSEDKTLAAMESIRADVPNSGGALHFIRLDLSDLASVKAAADAFLSREQKLHLLFNNAGVGYPEKGATTAQGHELQLGVNCIGPFALTKLLTPRLVAAARTSPKDSVRVVWVSSSAAEGVNPATFMESLAKIQTLGQLDQYSLSKLGNYLHAAEHAARYKADGVLSVSLNPGALDSEFWRTQGSVTTWLLRRTLLYPPIYGAYTNLFAGFSPEVTADKSGSYIAPWGQLWRVSKDMLDAAKTTAEGGTGVAREFWQWCEEQVESYI